MANQTAPDRTVSDQLRRCPETGVALRTQNRQYDKARYNRRERRKDFTSFYVELLKEPGRRDVVRCWANNKDLARQVGEQLVSQRGYWKVGRVLSSAEAREQLPKWWAYLRLAGEDHVFYARDELALSRGQPLGRKPRGLDRRRKG